ncbi:MAG: N-acetylmuramoyl-L-alanine amidase [Candidatus Azobacteroides sp.]|nr:N-acetylmuramoyl-L-alanine amidase [Candidatus Azobacteroides sp.]
MKYCFKLLIVVFVFLFSGTSLFAYDSGDFVLVIDPGHGGRDYGAPGSKSKEKNINLDVALLFGELVMAKHPDVKVVFTRRTDKFVDLKERSDIANAAKADLFISIHANASTSRSPFGAETYTLGLARTEENLEVAKRENSVILLEDNYKVKYEGFDPNVSESYIIFEFIRNKYMAQSVDFASAIQEEFKKTSKRSDRGVRQAGFLVLRETSMPSVLIELGFISNPTEEAYMTSAVGQQSLANSLFNAFTQFKIDHDRKSGYYLPAGQEADKTTSSASTTKQAPKQTPPTSTTVVQTPPVSHAPLTSEPAKTPTNVQQGVIVYKVQILASSSELPLNSPQLKGYKASRYVDTDGLYKYTFGSSTDPDEISQLKAAAKKDFPDAFTVKFVNGVRVK